MPTFPIQDAFTSGEWSPKMHGEVTHDKYRFAAKRMENFVILPQGPAQTRCGTRVIIEAKFPDKKCLIRDFVYSRLQSYTLEFGDLYIRFFTNQGQIESSPGIPYEVATPYLESELADLQFKQSSDVVYIFHGSHPVMKLSRYGSADFRLTQVQWNDGPYLQENQDHYVHLVASALTGAITVTAENRYSNETLSSWDGAAAAAEAVMTTTTPYGAFRFKPENAGFLISFKLNLATGASVPGLLGSAYLYSDNEGSPGVILGSCLEIVSLDSAGDISWNFALPLLTADVWYWICFSADTPDDSITVACVNDLAAFGSGDSATAFKDITDSLGKDFKAVLTYEPTGPASVFLPGHVGSTWRIRHSGDKKSSTFTAVKIGSAIKLLGDFTVEITVDTSWAGQINLQASYDQQYWFDVGVWTTSVKESKNESKTGVWYRLNCVTRSAGTAHCVIYQVEHWGVFQVTEYVSASEVRASVIADIGATSPSPFWREGAWSDVRGYPRTGCFRDQRLWMFDTEYQEQGFWTTWVGDFENMSPGSTDDAPVSGIMVDFNNPIQWAVSSSAFLAGTIGEEAVLATRKTEPVSASNPLCVDIQSGNGTASSTSPVKIGPSLLFVQQGRLKIRGMTYVFANNTFQADDLTLFADHITESGVVDMAYQKEPNSILWCVRADGVLAALTYYPQEKIIGWTRVITDGFVESVASIPSSFGDTASRFELWMVVRRIINGQTKRFIELMADFEGVTDQSDYFCVDCGIVFTSATPSYTATGLDHLEGKTVSIFADGAPQAQRVVYGGSVALDPPALKAIIGLPFTCVLEPLDWEAGTKDGTSQARVKQIERVTLRVLNTLMGQIGPDVDHLDPISNWVADQTLLGVAPSIRTEDIVTDGWQGEARPDANLMVVIDQPIPATIVAIMPVITTND